MATSESKKEKGIFGPFSSFVEDFFRDPEEMFQSMFRRKNMPPINVAETSDGLDVEVAAPGLKKEDFKVEVKNGLLLISAESQKGTKGEAREYVRQEFSYHSFQRTFSLPEWVKPEEIKATYQEGILHIRIPKKNAEKKAGGRNIPID